MSRGVNKVILVGNLGNDPEIRNMPNGTPVTQATLATSETWKDKNTGANQERTEWHRLVFFNRLAEIAADYCRKGSQIYIEGRLRTRKWQDKQGIDRYTTEIMVDEMQMLGSVRDKQNESPNHGISTRQPDYTDNTVPNNNANGYAPTPPNNGDDFNDDIPF